MAATGATNLPCVEQQNKANLVIISALNVFISVIKYQSDSTKKGEPEDHKKAVAFIAEWLDIKGLETDKEYCFFFPDEFMKEKGILYSFHQPDLTVLRGKIILAVIELDGVTDYTVTVKGERLKGKRTRHSTKPQKIRDGIFADYLERYYPHCKLVRIEKADAFNVEWLDKKLRTLVS